MRAGGQWVVLGMLAIALAASVGAWIWNLNHSQRALTFWGPKASQLVLKAPRVELLRLAEYVAGEGSAAGAIVPNSELEPKDALQVEGRLLRILARKDLSAAPGLIHARHSLTDDASFLRLVTVDEAGKASPAGAWTYALSFSDGQETATVLLDFLGRKVQLLETNRSAEVSERFVEGWQDFCRRQLGE